MKKALATLLCGAVISTSMAGELSLKTKTDSMSYAIAYEMVGALKPVKSAINEKVFLKAIKDILNSDNEQVSKEERQKYMQEISRVIREQQQADRLKIADENKAKGEKFLETKAAEEGVNATESGLHYKVLTAAEGPKPKAIDKVKVHYTGKLINGEVFDSSKKRGTPATFPLSGVIKGWTEGLQLMNVGSTFEFYIPAELAYGKNGAGAQIGPNETLIFEVELLEIVSE